MDNDNGSSQPYNVRLNQDIEDMALFARRVWEATQHTLDVMEDGDRIQLGELTQTVGLVMAKDPKKILDLVRHFAHNTKVAYITRGKKGGLIKGARPVKKDED